MKNLLFILTFALLASGCKKIEECDVRNREDSKNSLSFSIKDGNCLHIKNNTNFKIEILVIRIVEPSPSEYLGFDITVKPVTPTKFKIDPIFLKNGPLKKIIVSYKRGECITYRNGIEEYNIYDL